MLTSYLNSMGSTVVDNIETESYAKALDLIDCAPYDKTRDTQQSG